MCAFYPVCGSGSACFLIMRYRANSSSSCLLVVHIEVLDVVLYAPVFCSSILKGIISPVWFGAIEVCRVEVYSV